MQPHSMCAVALANYLWNNPYRSFEQVDGCDMSVSYRNTEGKYRTMKYELTNLRVENDNRSLVVLIMRSGGGIACNVTVRRNTTEEGAQVEMTHSQNHVSGLREVFILKKKEIASGRHYNSKRYKDFEGENAHPDRLKLKMKCDVRVGPEKFVTIPYELEITSVKMKRG